VGPKTLTDATFIASANDVCKRMLTPLITADRPAADDKNAVVADKTESAAAGLDVVVAALRRLPVQPADQASVTAWLDGWTQYTATGHQLATAIRRSSSSAKSSGAR
jgi:hypothetical protein